MFRGKRMTFSSLMNFSEARKTSLSLLHVPLSGQRGHLHIPKTVPGKGDSMTGLDKPESPPELQMGLASTGFCYMATGCKAGCQEERRGKQMWSR